MSTLCLPRPFCPILCCSIDLGSGLELCGAEGSRSCFSLQKAQGMPGLRVWASQLMATPLSLILHLAVLSSLLLSCLCSCQPHSQLIQFTSLLEHSLFLIVLLLCQDPMCIGSGMEQHVPRLVLCGITVAAQVLSNLPHCHRDNDGCGTQNHRQA